MFNKNQYGNNFSLSTIEAVWNKGQIDSSYDPSGKNHRRDKCGALIVRSAYGNTNSNNGWEIDHIIPKSKGGTDDLSNLQPLQWSNNRSKSDSWPANNYCVVMR